MRVAVRKLRRAFGGFQRARRHAGDPGEHASPLREPEGVPAFAIRLAAVAKVPVEVLLGGKLVVTTPVIGRAA